MTAATIFDVSGRVALITGAATGLGRAMAEALGIPTRVLNDAEVHGAGVIAGVSILGVVVAFVNNIVLAT